MESVFSMMLYFTLVSSIRLLLAWNIFLAAILKLIKCIKTYMYLTNSTQLGSHFLCEFSFINLNCVSDDGASHLDVLLPEASDHNTAKASSFLACSSSNFYTMIFLLLGILATPVRVRNEHNMQDNSTVESHCNHTEIGLN